MALCLEFDHRVNKGINVFTFLYYFYNLLLFCLNTFLSSHRLNHIINKELDFFLVPPHIMSFFFLCWISGLLFRFCSGEFWISMNSTIGLLVYEVYFIFYKTKFSRSPFPVLHLWLHFDFQTYFCFSYWTYLNNNSCFHS